MSGTHDWAGRTAVRLAMENSSERRGSTAATCPLPSLRRLFTHLHTWPRSHPSMHVCPSTKPQNEDDPKLTLILDDNIPVAAAHHQQGWVAAHAKRAADLCVAAQRLTKRDFAVIPAWQGCNQQLRLASGAQSWQRRAQAPFLQVHQTQHETGPLVSPSTLAPPPALPPTA